MTHRVLIHIQLILLFLLIAVAAYPQNRNNQVDYEALQSAHDLYYDRRYSEALEAYQALLKNASSQLATRKGTLDQNTKDSIRINMGQCHAKLGDDTSATRILREVINDDPNGSYASQAVSQIGNLFVRRYQYKQAILACKQLANKYPKTETADIAHYLIGQYLYSSGEYDEAIKEYRKFLDDFPTSPYRSSALYSLVRLYISRQQFDEAEEVVRDRLRHNPNDMELIKQLADLYKEQGKRNEALSLYQAVLANNPKDTTAIKRLGELYAENGQRERAIQEWSKIVQTNPNQSYRHQQLGAIYKSHQMYEEAIENYETALKLNPKSAYLYRQLADIYKIQGKIDKAIETYLRALRAVDIGYSGRSTTIEEIAEIYEGEQRDNLLEQVIAQVQEALKAEPQNPNLVLSLAELLFYHGHLDLALENFKRLAKLHKADHGQILENYAQLLARNKHPKAVDYYKTVVALFPTGHLAWNARLKLARLHEHNGQWQEALIVLTSMPSRDTSARLLLGHVWLHGIRDVEAALQLYQALQTNQSLTPKQQQQVWLGVAECHILLEQYDTARDILVPIADDGGEHASMFPTSQANARKLIGDTYLFAGAFEAAIAEYKKVLDVSVSDPASNDALARIILIQSNSDYAYVPLHNYVKALHANLNGKTDTAMEQSQKTISEYPKAMIVDDLWLLLGEIHQRSQAHAQAIEAYKHVVESESPGAAEALVKIAGIYHNQLNQPEQAYQTYAALIRDYPDSVIVDYARRQIDEIAKLK